MPFHFDNSYARLPERFFVRLAPDVPPAPRLVVFNRTLAETLGLSLSDAEAVRLLSGAELPPGAEPLAQAYAGHQFGQFQPQLGDGRAHLIGEIIAPDGRRYDLQLKGSGRTPFSRRGDGKATLGPMMREYIISEAMAGLGIPTTRALAVTLTGEAVMREGALPGAVLARAAASHIRVGTFQYFAARGDGEAIDQLARYTLARHFGGSGDDAALQLYTHVIDAQAELVARWLGAGFIHGVMNTDNMALSGETIDYGPCAFMDDFHPARVFSSIDNFGRYAYGEQGRIAQWNIARFAETVLPLFSPDEDKALALAQDGLTRFASRVQAAWRRVFGAKIGLATAHEGDDMLINDLLALMGDEAADFTLTFRALTDDETRLSPAFAPWLGRWHERIGDGLPAARELMRQVNPVVIARNHRVEQAIEAGVTANDFTPMHTLVAALQQPFAPRVAEDPLLAPPRENERVCQTFCGT